MRYAFGSCGVLRALRCVSALDRNSQAEYKQDAYSRVGFMGDATGRQTALVDESFLFPHLTSHGRSRFCTSPALFIPVVLVVRGPDAKPRQEERVMLEQSMTDQFTRYAVALSLQYRRSGEAGAHPGVGWTRDLSVRGTWVELPESLPLATGIEIRLRTAREAPWLATQVAWIRPEPTSRGLYLHGLTFVRVTPEQRRRLHDFLAEQKQNGAVRLYRALAVTCLRRESGLAPLPGQTRDLSSGGAAVRLPEPVPPGTSLHVTVHTMFGKVSADAEVVWAESPEPRPPGALYRHGLRFLRFGMASGLPLSLVLAGLR
jgi:hypothetical protein